MEVLLHDYWAILPWTKQLDHEILVRNTQAGEQTDGTAAFCNKGAAICDAACGQVHTQTSIQWS